MVIYAHNVWERMGTLCFRDFEICHWRSRVLPNVYTQSKVVFVLFWSGITPQSGEWFWFPQCLFDEHGKSEGEKMTTLLIGQPAVYSTKAKKYTSDFQCAKF